MTLKRLTHEFPAFFHKDSMMLFLGSFPSVKSREQQFYYGHPQNRFWKIMTVLFAEEEIDTEKMIDPSYAEEVFRNHKVPVTRDEKAAFAKMHHIALWDVIDSCEIEGSSDASIQNAVVNDLSLILPKSRVTKIYVNGATAYRLFRKHMLEDAIRLGLREEDCVGLPSTSPANAAWTLPKLLDAWKIIRTDGILPAGKI